MEARRLLSRATQRGQGTRGTDVKPGDYALGSPQSRAAARSLLAARRAAEGEGTMFVLKASGSPAPGNEMHLPYSSSWHICSLQVLLSSEVNFDPSCRNIRKHCAGPGSVNARRAKRGLTGSGLVRDTTSIRHEGTLADALSDNSTFGRLLDEGRESQAFMASSSWSQRAQFRWSRRLPRRRRR